MLKKAISAVERLLNVRIVRPSSIGTLFEEDHLRRFLSYFDVDCIFDVGANAGQYACMLRERAGYSGPIVSYEPTPRLADLLRSRVANDPAWFVEELALDRDAGSAAFNIMAGNQFSSLHEAQSSETELFIKQTAIENKVKVQTSTLAIELEKYGKLLGFKRPFLKMDTQGHDLAVAEGAKGKLRTFVGLQSELAIKRIYAGAPSYDESLRYFFANGFELSALVPNNAGHFPHLIEMDCIMYRV